MRSLDTVLHVFRKDGLELLRDRRTLFVNVVLPVLLYPVLALFGIQILQLTRTATADLPRIAALDATPLLEAQLAAAAEALAEAAAADEAAQAEGQPAMPAPGEAVPRFVYHELEPDQAQTLRPLIAELPGPSELDLEDPELPAEQRQAVLEALRAFDLAAVVSIRTLEHPEGFTDQSLIVVVDDAHRYSQQVHQALNLVFQRYESALIERRLSERGLPPDLVHPLRTMTLGVAPASEALRSKIAGVIPLLLVLMALSGAFYPALDLIAGERERGTLESLLAWPGNRRDLFLGKLLVVNVAALISVLLNLASLGVTMLILGTQGGTGGAAVESLSGGLSLGAGVLALCFMALLPLVVTLSAVSLAVAGLAASFKEAQNYLSPLFLVVMVPAFVTMIPGAQPTTTLDLVPVVGPLLALKESMQSPHLPWGHVLLATAASAALAAVVVAWSVRLLETERFLYPGLVRAGWGRFRKWGRPPEAPGGMEALAIFAVALAGFLYLGPLFAPLGPVAQVVGPLIAGIALPTLLGVWLGGWQPRSALHWRAPHPADWLRAGLLVPIGLGLSLGLFTLQSVLIGPPPADQMQTQEMERIVGALDALGGMPLLVLCMAVVPGITEELLCRGPLLSGLRRGLGTVGGVLISAFLFAALHGTPYRFLPQMVLGVVLAVLVLRSGSVWTAMLVHAGHNAAILFLAEALEGRELGLGFGAATTAIAAALAWLVLRHQSSTTDAAAPPPSEA